jgi:hypothetical protein
MRIKIVLATLVVAPAALAEESSLPPHCGPELDGQVICRFNSVYECQYVSPRSLERHAGWRWVQNLLQACDKPASAEGSQGPPPQLPPGFSYAPQIGNTYQQPEATQSTG